MLMAVCAEAMAERPDSLSRWGFSLGVSPGLAIVMDQYQRKWQKEKDNFSIDLAAHHVALPSDSDAFASDYGYPTLTAGVKMSFNHGVTMQRSADPAWGMAEMVDYESHMGNAVAVYGSFNRPFFRNDRWEADYSLAFGVGYSKTIYDCYNNVDNELIGSHWSIFFGAGAHLYYRLASKWALRAGVDYWHMSNGALDRPNKGANFIGPSLALCYYPYAPALYQKGVAKVREPFKPYMFINVGVGIGGRSLFEEWQLTQFQTPAGSPGYRTGHFRIYPTYSVQADFLVRYARRWASGIGADVFYGPYASEVEKIEESKGIDVPHSPWSVGIAAKHQAFYKQLSVSVALGVYLYREMGQSARNMEKPYYERVGVQYSFPSLGGFTVGAFVKAHATKADLTEFIFSYPFLL